MSARINWNAQGGAMFHARTIGEAFVSNGPSPSGFEVYEKRSKSMAVLLKAPGLERARLIGTYKAFAPMAWTFNAPEVMP